MRLQKNRQRISYKIYKYAWAGLDLLFPPHCGGCNSPGSRWCQQCQNKVKRISSMVCVKCGRPIKYQSTCLSCDQNSPSFDGLRSWAYYEGPVRKAIHNLKYRGDITLGEILARPLIRIVGDNGWSPDLVLPVPMGIKRLSNRGYNHAILLARPVALALGKAFDPYSLRKIRETSTQVGLSLSERLTNVKGSFQAIERKVQTKNILVIDDVTTSGATMEACAFALKKAGANQVFGLTIARTRFDADYSLYF